MAPWFAAHPKQTTGAPRPLSVWRKDWEAIEKR